MDPLSVLGVLSASAQIAQFIGQTIQALSTLRGKFKDADFKISLLINELSTIRNAIRQLHDWAEYNSKYSPKENEYLKGLGVALDGCTAAMEVLDEEVKELAAGVEINGDSKPLPLGFLAKAKLIWSEDTMRGHQERLRSQVQALQLLLSAGQCHSSTQQIELLQLKENRRIIKKVEDDTRTLREAMSAAGSLSGASTRNYRESIVGSTEFEFDPTLMQSELYRNARRKEPPKPNETSKIKPVISTASSEKRTSENELEKSDGQPPTVTTPINLARNYSTISVVNPRGARPSSSKDSLGLDKSDIPRSRSVGSTYSQTSAGSEPKIRRWLSSSSSATSTSSQSSKFADIQKRKFWDLSRVKTLSSPNLKATARKSQQHPKTTISASRYRGMRSQETNLNQSINFASADGLDAPALVRAAQAGSRVEVEKRIDHGDDIECRHEPTGLTALAVAAHCGHGDVVETLIQLNANVNTRDLSLSTPLHLAASRGHIPVMGLLLEQHVPLEEQDDQKRTALFLAAERGYLDAVELLLHHKAKINARGENMLTPLHSAAQRGDEVMTHLLLRNGAHIEVRDSLFMTPLHYACENGHENVVSTLLNERASIESMGANEKSSLICAAAGGHIHIVDLLLRKKASIRSKDNRGNNALHWAASKGHVDVAELILQRKLPINEKNNEGSTALHLAVRYSQFSVVEFLLRSNAMLESRCALGRTPLHYACGLENKDIVRLLLSAGAHAEAAVDGELLRPLHIAATKGVPDIVQLLCERSVAIDPRDSAGDRPLLLACSYGHVEVAEKLLEFGAPLRLPFGDRSYEDSPLCIAAKEGHLSVVSLLIKRGASVRQKDELGWPPIRYAAHHGHPEVLEVLLLAANVTGDSGGGAVLDNVGFSSSSNITEERKQKVRELLSQAEDKGTSYMSERLFQPSTSEVSLASQPVELSGLGTQVARVTSLPSVQVTPQVNCSPSATVTDIVPGLPDPPQHQILRARSAQNILPPVPINISANLAAPVISPPSAEYSSYTSHHESFDPSPYSPPNITQAPQIPASTSTPLASATNRPIPLVSNPLVSHNQNQSDYVSTPDLQPDSSGRLIHPLPIRAHPNTFPSTNATHLLSQSQSRAHISQLIEAHKAGLAQLQMILPSIDEGEGSGNSWVPHGIGYRYGHSSGSELSQGVPYGGGIPYSVPGPHGRSIQHSDGLMYRVGYEYEHGPSSGYGHGTPYTQQPYQYQFEQPQPRHLYQQYPQHQQQPQHLYQQYPQHQQQPQQGWEWSAREIGSSTGSGPEFVSEPGTDNVSRSSTISNHVSGPDPRPTSGSNDGLIRQDPAWQEQTQVYLETQTQTQNRGEEKVQVLHEML